VSNTAVHFEVCNCLLTGATSAVRLGGVQHGILSDLICKNNGDAGIILSNSHNNTLLNITSSHNDGYGIVLNLSDNNTIHDSVCCDNYYYGVYLDNSNENSICELECSVNGHSGIVLSGCQKNDVNNTICSDNFYFGISLYESTSTIIHNNTCYQNGIGASTSGIHIHDDCDSTILTDNLLAFNTHLSNIMKESKRKKLITKAQLRSWDGMIQLRNAIVHNNGVFERDREFSIGSIKITTEAGKSIETMLVNFPCFMKTLISLTRIWIEKYLDIHEV
jgi:parallel beta-helix repeat protein